MSDREEGRERGGRREGEGRGGGRGEVETPPNPFSPESTGPPFLSPLLPRESRFQHPGGRRNPTSFNWDPTLDVAPCLFRWLSPVATANLGPPGAPSTSGKEEGREGEKLMLPALVSDSPCVEVQVRN